MRDQELCAHSDGSADRSHRSTGRRRRRTTTGRFTTWTTARRRASSRRRARPTRPPRMRRTRPRRRTTAETAANDAVHRADSLDSVVKGLDNYKQVANVSVTFGFDKAVLTADDKQQLDSFAGQLGSAKSYILEVTGGTDSIGPAQYNYDLSQRRADAVVQYLAAKYNIAAAPVLPDRHRQGPGSGRQQHGGRAQAEPARAGAVAVEHERRSSRPPAAPAAGRQATPAAPAACRPSQFRNRLAAYSISCRTPEGRPRVGLPLSFGGSSRVAHGLAVRQAASRARRGPRWR